MSMVITYGVLNIPKAKISITDWIQAENTVRVSFTSTYVKDSKFSSISGGHNTWVAGYAWRYQWSPDNKKWYWPDNNSGWTGLPSKTVKNFLISGIPDQASYIKVSIMGMPTKKLSGKAPNTVERRGFDKNVTVTTNPKNISTIDPPEQPGAPTLTFQNPSIYVDLESYSPGARYSKVTSYTCAMELYRYSDTSQRGVTLVKTATKTITAGTNGSIINYIFGTITNLLSNNTPVHAVRARLRANCKSNTGAAKSSEFSEFSSMLYLPPDTPKKPLAIKTVDNQPTSVEVRWYRPSRLIDAKLYYYKDNLNTEPQTMDITYEDYPVQIDGLDTGHLYLFTYSYVHNVSGSPSVESNKCANYAKVIIGAGPDAPTLSVSTTHTSLNEEVAVQWLYNASDGSILDHTTLYYAGNDWTGVSVNIPYGSTSLSDQDQTLHGVWFTKNGIKLKNGTILPWRDPHVSLRTLTDGERLSFKITCTSITGTSPMSDEKQIAFLEEPSVSFSVISNDISDDSVIHGFPIEIVPSYSVGAIQKVVRTTLSIVFSGDSSEYETFDGSTVIYSDGDVLARRSINVQIDNKHEYYIFSYKDLAIIPNYGDNVRVEVDILTDYGLLAHNDLTLTWGQQPTDNNITIACLFNYISLDDVMKPTYDMDEDIEELPGPMYDTNQYSHGVLNINVYEDEFVDEDDTGDEDHEMATASGYIYSVYRKNYDNTYTLLASDIDPTSNFTVDDPYPSLNIARYLIVATNTTTGYSIGQSFSFDVKDPVILIQWNLSKSEENFDRFAIETSDVGLLIDNEGLIGNGVRLPYNIDTSPSVEIDSEEIEYIGRKSPVSYYGTMVRESTSLSSVILKEDTATLTALRELQKYNGDVYIREPSGIGYWANVKVEYSLEHTNKLINISIEATKVDGSDHDGTLNVGGIITSNTGE